MENSDLSVYVAVIVAPAGTDIMQLGARLEQACGAAGLEVSGLPRLLGATGPWVSVECDVSCEDGNYSEARASLEAGLGGEADVALLPALNRRKRLLVSDMDSTIIQQECLDELAAYAGLKDEIAAITARAMAGELDFEGALTERVGKLEGLSMDALDQCFRERISLMPGAKTLTATMRAFGARCLLVSGGFTYFTSRIAGLAGFDEDQGNVLEDNGTTLTGKVRMPILGREAKLSALDNAAEALKITRADALAMGDGANDLAMIEGAGLGLAVHAKPIVAGAADAAINVTDLSAALFFQGYKEQEIVWQD